MAVALPDCAEDANATDCLLRDLLRVQAEWKEKTDHEYNWDPMTFYFTVAIAAFAAIFAFIATVQAALSSGSQGRRRSDHRAIGLWALKTDWSWQWSGFTSLHRTETPVLTESAFEALLEGPSKREKRFIVKLLFSKLRISVFGALSGIIMLMLLHVFYMFISLGCFLVSPFFILAAVFTCGPFTFMKTRDLRSQLLETFSTFLNSGYDVGFVELVLAWIPLSLLLPFWPIFLVYIVVMTPASLLGHFFYLLKIISFIGISNDDVSAAWVGFFDMVGLGHIHPDIFIQQEQTRTKTAEYLPADVQAVPADGQVGLVILLLVLREGHTTWANDPASDFPVVSGKDYRLQFSQHPYLGTVAVFRDSTYFPTGSGEVSEANQLSRGSFSTIQTAFRHARASVDLDSFLGTCEDDQESLDLASWSSLSNILTRHTVSCKHNCKACYGWKNSMVGSPSSLLVFLFSKTPSDLPAVFPGNVAQPQGMLSALTMGSGFWRGRRFTASGHHALTELLGQSDQVESGCLCESNAASPTSWKCNLVFNACSLLAGEPSRFDSWFNALPQLEALELRQRAHSLAEDLDKWLRAASNGAAENKSEGPDVACRASLLAMRATSFLSLARALGYDDGERGGNLHETLEEYFNEERRDGDPDGEVTKDAYLKDPRLRRITEYLAGSPKYADFQNLRGTVLPALKKDVRNAEQGMTADEYRPSPEQRIDDVLIFRCLLITILFRTAFDNSNLLASGAWDQIIPIL